MMLKWFDQNCNLDHHTDHIKYFMKVDEDVYVNLPKLTKFLRKYSGNKLLMGRVRCDPNPTIEKAGNYKKQILKAGYNPKYHNLG